MSGESGGIERFNDAEHQSVRFNCRTRVLSVNSMRFVLYKPPSLSPHHLLASPLPLREGLGVGFFPFSCHALAIPIARFSRFLFVYCPEWYSGSPRLYTLHPTPRLRRPLLFLFSVRQVPGNGYGLATSDIVRCHFHSFEVATFGFYSRHITTL